MRCTRPLMWLLICLSCLGTAGRVAADYRLVPLDGVRIRLIEWPHIAGDYTVTPEGRLSLPLLGEIEVAGLSAAQVAERLTSRLKERTGAGSAKAAAVEVIRFRPIYVIGDVQRPGEHEFRPGSTVLHGIGLAGGYFRPANPTMFRLQRDLEMARGDAQTLALRQILLTVKAARLAAAMRDEQQFEVPTQADRAPAVTAAIQAEQESLRLQQQRLEEDNRSVAALRSLYQQEIASLKNQIVALKKEAEPMQRQLSELRNLSKRGLANAPSLMILERSVSQNENEQLAMNTTIVRALQQIELAEHKANQARLERRRELDKELTGVQTELVDVRGRLATARALIREVFATDEREAGSLIRDPGRAREITVIRSGPSGRQELPAATDTPVEPGDVIDVKPLPPPQALESASR